MIHGNEKSSIDPIIADEFLTTEGQILGPPNLFSKARDVDLASQNFWAKFPESFETRRKTKKKKNRITEREKREKE